MNIFSVLLIFGGIALFLYGMKLMGNGLEKLAGGKLEKILERLTSNSVVAVLLGAGVTAIIQSSSATTVTVVGFVNSGIMTLKQAVGIIMGANIGTTATGWILLLSLTENASGSFIADLFNSSNFTALAALIGILLFMFSKRDGRRDLGTILLGFAILMFAMSFISDTVAPLKDVPAFTQAISVFENPLLGVLIGAIITAVLQSSSASVGILQVLAFAGSISYGTVFPVIMGMNIGASVPALISCIGAKLDARRAAFIYLYYNILGTAICLPLYYLINHFLVSDTIEVIATPLGIAVVNTLIKVVSTLILLPFTKFLCRLAEVTIVDHGRPAAEPFLEERFLKTPSFAIEQCRKVTVDMSKTVKVALLNSITLLNHYDQRLVDDVRMRENEADHYEDKLGNYLVKLSSASLSMKDSNEVIELLHTIGDFERISDHAVNLVDSAVEIYNKEINFSEDALAELSVIENAISEIVEITFNAFAEENATMAGDVEPLEQVIDKLCASLKSRHIDRLLAGNCTIELGFVFSDILTNFERVSDHCSNIAVALLQNNDSSFETHSSMNTIKTSGSDTFTSSYESYSHKYALK